jgi:hypothetical protein
MHSTANPTTGTFIAFRFRIEVREVLFLMVHLSSCTGTGDMYFLDWQAP